MINMLQTVLVHSEREGENEKEKRSKINKKKQSEFESSSRSFSKSVSHRRGNQREINHKLTNKNNLKCLLLNIMCVSGEVTV